MNSKPFLYLDHCGTTALSKIVKQKLLSTIEENHFGNPTAVHHLAGLAASEDVEESRKTIASALRCKPQNVIFTSGASEANNLVILGFWLRFQDRGVRVLYGATEHKSVLEAAKQVGSLPKGEANEIPVDQNGVAKLDVLESYLKDNPRKFPTLVCLMQTNNEVPARNNIEAIASLCKAHRAYFHCDTVQTYVREALNMAGGNYGSVVLSPHKFYGPKGIGILVMSDSALRPPVVPPYTGGEQEFGLRPGTLNTMVIGATAVAVSQHEQQRPELIKHLAACDEAFCNAMTERCPAFHLTVPRNASVPGIINFYIDNYDAPTLLQKLERVCINRGASCTGAGGEKYSHVPKALGLPIEIQANVLRASFGWGCSVEDVISAAEEISAVVATRK